VKISNLLHNELAGPLGVKRPLERLELVTLRAALHLDAMPICCVRGLKSPLVISQKAQIGPNPFTLRGRANLVV
jgi:hypothetical protein